jgi:hypothetical protein
VRNFAVLRLLPMIELLYVGITTCPRIQEPSQARSVSNAHSWISNSQVGGGVVMARGAIAVDTFSLSIEAQEDNHSWVSNITGKDEIRSRGSYAGGSRLSVKRGIWIARMTLSNWHACLFLGHSSTIVGTITLSFDAGRPKQDIANHRSLQLC